MKDHSRIRHFLQTYLAAEDSPNITSAIRSFVRDEGPQLAESLREELREWLSVGAPLDQIRDLFAEEGQFLLGESDAEIRAQLLSAFEDLRNDVPSPNTGGAEKPFDAFISYSSSDRVVANRLALALKNKGFAVWLDSWEILVGHNIVDEVFKGISDSEFLIVVLSPASVQSRWVQEELTTGKVGEIEQRRVTVLPVVVEQCEIPIPLRNKRYANLAESWDQGIRELTAAIEFHRAEAQSIVARFGPSPQSFDLLDEFRTRLVDETLTLGFTHNMAFKDIAIGPPDDASALVDRRKLMSLIESSRVEIAGWGGPPFPYEPFSADDIRRLPSGIGVVDTRPWPYKEKSFHFWRLDESLRFYERSDLTEDYATNANGELFLQGKLGVEWAVLDIARPLVFASRLLSRERQVGTLGLNFAWGGLDQRALSLLSPGRVGLLKNYQCHVSVWNRHVEVTPGMDLVEVAYSCAEDLFWLFSWEPPTGFLRPYIETVVQGRMPR